MTPDMLLGLSLRDFVLVRRLDLEPEAGFTALTGETGAGKSILLDALGVALGGAPERRYVRAGADQAVVAAEFALPPDHEAWALAREQGLDAAPDEPLVLKRLVRRQGPSRALVNDQPVSAAFLATLAGRLVEIHGQRSALGLLSPANHLALLDQYAGNGDLLSRCGAAWARLQTAHAHVEAARSEHQAGEAARAEQAALAQRLAALAPEPGEAGRLESERQRLLQAAAIGETVAAVTDALGTGRVEAGLAAGVRALERLSARVAGNGAGELAIEAAGLGAMLERALIEVQEAERALGDLAALAGDGPERLEALDQRLASLRTVAGRLGVKPDDLAAHLGMLEDALGGDGDTAVRVTRAETELRSARAAWHGAAEALSRARRHAAGRLDEAVAAELEPLKLGRCRFRVDVTELDGDDTGGPSGRDRVCFLIETNPGAGFGPLEQIASGGELARLALALRCALSDVGCAAVLVFDEADHGVGGAVAAAIGERFARLGAARQVLAVTHSPQVAAAAGSQWAVTKDQAGPGLGETGVLVLDERARCEEIARMLSGATVTAEARAAAAKLIVRTEAEERPWRNRSRLRR